MQTNGTFVAAVTNGGVNQRSYTQGAQIVNGVAFKSCSAYTYPTFTYGSSPISLAWTTANNNYGNPGNAYGGFGYRGSQLLLTGGGDINNSGNGNITLSSLVNGSSYQVQVWAPTWNGTFTRTYGGVTLRIGNPPGSVSQYVVGTFTADAATQTIPWTGVAPTAVSLRLLTPAPNPADAGNSTVAANPASPATAGNDGVCWSTISVTLKDASNNPVWGKTVALAQTTGSGATISATSGPSGLDGVVTFSVTSTTLGAATFTATDTTDSVVITATAAVDFELPATITSIAAGDWNTAGTWDVKVPTSGDVVIIDGKAITVNTTPAGAALLTLNGASSITVAAGQSLATDAVAFSNGNNVAITGAGQVVIGPARNLQVTSTAAQWTDINAQIVDNPSGASAVTIATGGGEVNWKGFNMYSGGTTITGGGQFNAQNASCFGSGPVVLNGGTKIAYLSGQANSLTINNGILAGGGSWNGAITLPTGCTAVVRDNAGLYGKITGAGGIAIINSARFANGASDYTGKTVVTSGTLSYSSPMANAGSASVLGAPTGDNAVIDLYPGTAFVYTGGQGSRVPPYFSTDRTINLAGDGPGTVALNGNNCNDTGLQFAGFTATGTKARTLQITARGDSTMYTYTGGIPDMSDGSPVSLSLIWSTQSSRCDGLINLRGTNTFTGPITLTGGSGGGPGNFLVGGLAGSYVASNVLTVVPGGTGVLGNGNYAGNITFTANPSSVLLYYASSVPQTLSGAISGPGALTVGGTGVLTLAGTAGHTGNTTVNSGSALVLDPAGTLTFKPTNSTTNKLTGAGTATLDGTFNIDTSAVTSAIASWTLVDVTNKTYGSNFKVNGFIGSGGVWTKVSGFTTWTFTQSSSVLSVSTLATITAFGIAGHDGVIVQGAPGTIAISVPYGTNLSTFAPTFTVSTGIVTANGNAVSSGSPPSPPFSVNNPTTYIVTDGSAVSTYVVTVTVAPAPPGGLGVDVGLVAWYDASQLSGLSNGNSVDTWADLSSYGHKATRTAGTMTYATNQVNGLPTVQFRSAAYANITGTMFAKEQYMVFKTPTGNSYGGDWGAVMGDVTDQCGYMMGNGTNFWNGNYPAAVSQNGTVLANPWNITNMGTFLILKIDGTYPNTTPRNYSLGGVYGNGSPQYHNVNLDVAEVIAYDHVLTAEQELALGAYLTVKYNIAASTYPTGPQATITSFTFPTYGDATITGTTITKFVPNGTVVTALAPTFTLSTGATCVPGSGSTHSFSGPVHYLVTASDNTTKDYTVTVTVLPPGPPVLGYARWFDASTLVLANNAGVTQWNDGSGNGANATVPSGNATPVYVANAGTESGLGAIYFAGNSGAGNSAALRFTSDSSIRTVFSVFKGNSFLLTANSSNDFHRGSDNNATDPLWGAAPSGSITGGSTYVNGALVTGTSFAMPTNLHGGFNLVEVLTTGNVTADSFNKDRTYHSGNQYQAEVIIYDRKLSEPERLQVEVYLTSKWFASAPANSYGTWAAAQVPPVAGGPTHVGPDGISNLLLYALNLKLDGTNGSPGTLTDHLLSFTKRADAVTNGDVSYAIETSPNLQNPWTPVTPDVNNGSTISYTLPQGAAGGAIFARLKVVQN